MSDRDFIVFAIMVLAMMQIGCVDRGESTGDVVRAEESTIVLDYHDRSAFSLSDGEVADYIRSALDNGDLVEAQQGLDAENRLQPGETFVVVSVSAQGMDRAMVFVRPTNPRSSGRNLQYIVMMDVSGRVHGTIIATGIAQP